MSGDLYRVMGCASLPTHTKPGWFELAYVCGCTMSKPSYTQVSNNTGDVNMTDIYLIGFCWFAICFVLGAIWIGRP